MTPEVLSETTSNPKDALNGILRLLDIRPDLKTDMDRLLSLAHIFSASDYLTDWLIARPEEIDWALDYGGLDAPRDKKEMAVNLKELMASLDAMSALRRFKHRELCRICARELSGQASFEETAQDWSTVADLAIDTAIEIAESAALKKYGDPIYTELTCDTERIARFAALGLGKLGGKELNISSDVDLIFIHSSDNGATSGPLSIPLHEFFVRIAREVTRLVSEVTEEGFVFRVDLDLRPEGKAGEITNSIGAMEIYYESWGQQWERQALIKARHCGGGAQVSQEVINRLHPFVYRKYMDEGGLKEISAMKKKIDLTLSGSKDIAYDIKLGRGGIREIEFVAQSMQLLYGARHSDLQTQSTIKALDVCDFLGFLSTPHYRDLKDTYYFHRKLENRIQYDRNQQTHKIPNDKQRKEKLGRLMGFDTGDPAGALMNDVKKRMKRIREIFDLFFIQDEKTGSETFPYPLDDEEAGAVWLDKLRFDHPRTSAKALNLLRNGSSFSHPSERSVMAFDRFGPYIVSQAATTPWPDHVILGFSNFVESRAGQGGRDLLYELLDEHRPVIKLLSAIFSSSEYLTAALLRQPDLLDRLLVSDPVEKPADRSAYTLEFKQSIAEKSSVETRLGLLNSFRAAESLRLGLRRILGLTDRFGQMNGLTLLAEEYIKAVAYLAQEEIDETRGAPEDVKWVLVAAGKLGRREMNFGSDIDLLVFYDNDDNDTGDASAYNYVVLLVQRVIRLSGAMTPFGDGYQIDMRLRPEGEAGPLVVSYNAMVDYYNNRGRIWERLALVGARPICGDKIFGVKVMGALGSFIESSETPVKPSDSDKIVKIRERIASERVKPGVVDIKFGRGGLIEIEFVCQWLAMENRETPREDRPFTLSMLKTARVKKWLEKDVADDLIKAYLFLRSLEDTLRMDKEKAVNVIPVSDTILLNRLSRAMEETPGGSGGLVEVIKETMRKVSGIYLRFFELRGEKK